MSEQNDARTLWSDGKSKEDIEYFANDDSDNVIYNLHEDVLCLKERIAELEKELNHLKQSELQQRRLLPITRQG